MSTSPETNDMLRARFFQGMEDLGYLAAALNGRLGESERPISQAEGEAWADRLTPAELYAHTLKLNAMSAHHLITLASPVTKLYERVASQRHLDTVLEQFVWIAMVDPGVFAADDLECVESLEDGIVLATLSDEYRSIYKASWKLARSLVIDWLREFEAVQSPMIHPVERGGQAWALFRLGNGTPRLLKPAEIELLLHDLPTPAVLDRILKLALVRLRSVTDPAERAAISGIANRTLLAKSEWPNEDKTTSAIDMHVLSVLHGSDHLCEAYLMPVDDVVSELRAA